MVECLDQDGSGAPADELAAAGRLAGRGPAADHGTLLGVTGQQERRRAQLAEAGEEGLERAAGQSTNPPGDHDVEPDVAALAEQIDQGGHGTAGWSGDEV